MMKSWNLVAVAVAALFVLMLVPPAQAADPGAQDTSSATAGATSGTGGDTAPFVEPGVDPQHYVDRYLNEAAYKKWFDESYPQYSSIYEAVGLPEPKSLASFVEPGVDPQHYVDRYLNEAAYKKWFDDGYPQYTSIYEAVGLADPNAPDPKPEAGAAAKAGTGEVASFVEPGVDPQHYVDRYLNEAAYKKWFDDGYPQYTSIYEAVGLADPNAPDPKPEAGAAAKAGTGEVASFVEPGVDPQHYVDRYLNEAAYKKWFDDGYPQYTSIYEAVGLADPNAPDPKPEAGAAAKVGTGEVASFVDPKKDPQHYVDRYLNEAAYKKWFDDAYPQYSSIYEAVGLADPNAPDPKPEAAAVAPAAKAGTGEVASFVEPGVDPQHYVDRYLNEAAYKKWFDESFTEYSSIYEAVGLEEPKGLAPFVDPKKDPQLYVDRYLEEASYKKWFDESFTEYSSIYEAVGLEEPKAGVCGEGTVLKNGVCVAAVENKPPQSRTCFLFWCW